MTSADWPRRQSLLDRIQSVLSSLPTRPAYYPGAHDRYGRFMEAHPDGRKVGRDGEGVVPWTVFPGLDPEDSDEICFQTEAFCGVLGEVGLSESDPVAFLKQAVDFCNDRVWGTLSCALIVHPKTESDPAFQAALQPALIDLRYGGIAINIWSGLCYGLVSTSWGAYPGHTNKDIVSGRGAVHNTYLLPSPQKSVVRAPFQVAPKPAFFCTHTRSHRVGQAIVGSRPRPPCEGSGRGWHAARG